MFVPAAKGAPEGPESSPAGSEQPADVAAIFETPAEPASATPEAEFDLDTFQLTIDREIDSLFSPSAGQTGQDEIADVSPEAPDRPKPVSKPAPVAPPQPTPFDFQEDRFSPGPPIEFKTKYPSRAELPKLVEVFNAAYLSLDWEFSRDNIRRLESALEDLESFLDSAPGAASIYKILKAILARLSARPQAANTRIVELVRDCQGLLAHLLLMQETPGRTSGNASTPL